MWRDSGSWSSKRFSYLLLDEGEFYVQDWIATCGKGSLDSSQDIKPSSGQLQKMKGRLQLCSKSIFFEPDSLSLPIIRFPMNKVKSVEALKGKSLFPKYSHDKFEGRQEGFVLEASLNVTMKENGLDAPYNFEKQDTTWWFSLEFSPVQQFLKQAQSFISINLLPNMERDMILYNTRAQKEARAQFDTTNLVDLSEKIFLDVPSAQVTPLVREAGRLIITQTRLYFQPMFNLNDDNPVRSEPLSAIIAVARRRHALRQVGLEIFFKEEDNTFKNVTGSGLAYGASAFFTFQSVEVRNNAAANLLDKIQGQAHLAVIMGSLLEAESRIVQSVAKAWQEHQLSNYDYLMYLNLAAGRSFCDLTQWPVMPWILRNYRSRVLDLTDPEYFRDLSKPIGALNPERLAIFKDRYMQIIEGGGSDPPFLYGTHYSTPGYVLYWLVRAAPAHMLRLQNGRFDAPDRLFVSMEESWENVLSNAADLKELIPEFFCFPSNFLQIRDNLKLGIRQRGDLVGDVILPPWANDADDFIIKHRQALECKHVSQHLHEWIDLIFGFKQRGMAALAADNLFHHLSYEGTVDLEKIDDPVERAGLEVQIHEFGQVPQQLFLEPHPTRFKSETEVGDTSLLPMQIDLRALIYKLMRIVSSIETESALNETRGATSLLAEPKNILGTKDVSSTYPFVYNQEKSFRIKSLQEPVDENIDINLNAQNGVTTAINDGCGPVLVRNSSLHNCNQTQIQGVDSGKMENQKSIRPDETTFISSTRGNSARGHIDTRLNNTNESKDTGQCDCSWYSMLRKNFSEPQSLKMHRGAVCAIALSEENASECLSLFSVGRDGFVKVYSISDGLQLRSTKLGSLPLSSLALAKSTDAYPVVLAGSFDNCVYAYSVDYGRALGKVRVHDDTVSCLQIIDSSSQKMVTASWDATIKIWNIDEGRGSWATTFGSSKKTQSASMEFVEHEGAVLCLDVGYENSILVSGSEDGSIIAWDTRTPTSIWHQGYGNKGSPAGLKLTPDSQEVLVAFGDGSFHILDVRKGGTLLASHHCETPLRCCESAGQLILAGSATGALHVWPLDIDLVNGLATGKDLKCAPVDDHNDAINCISVSHKPSDLLMHVATASEDGIVQVYTVSTCS
ncbi:uncharacterized protein LOC131035250 [Cryptomeria japonica]|uniref:uncharacterized protein LOC131035250 n=1 Tax=Cryptomeria japonica TaxID=3369 RepID=UPI0027DAAB88|nr:uncharacterized protein LOC131035250 [Cryptomeria japonica]